MERWESGPSKKKGQVYGGFIKMEPYVISWVSKEKKKIVVYLKVKVPVIYFLY